MGNRLSKIVTRTGDGGTTGLADGSRVDKDIPRMEAIGTIDELNSFLGLAESHIPVQPETVALRHSLILVQHDLFDLGAALSTPGRQLLSKAHVARLDDLIEASNKNLPALKEFILPGGSKAVGTLHVARSISRRAERRLISAIEIDPQPAEFGFAYLNRLSDYLFVTARMAARLEGIQERLWEANISLS